jgi:broad specificity phosphatase PhoE
LSPDNCENNHQTAPFLHPQVSPLCTLKAQLPNHPTRLYFIRHGEVEERYHRIFGGSRIDMALSSLGHQHARALADWFGESPVDAVYMSPMQRVRQTAIPLLEAKRLQPVVLEDLREVDFGDWTGYGWQDIQARFGVVAYDWLETLENGGIPNGETATCLKARVRPCLQRVVEENPHRSVAVVCHGGIVRVMLALLLEMPLSHMAHFNIDYGSVTLVELQPGKKHALEVELLNFCPLTDRAGARLATAERGPTVIAPQR